MPSPSLSLETLRLIQERMDFLSQHFWLGVERASIEKASIEKAGIAKEGTSVTPELRQALTELREFLVGLESGVVQQEDVLSRQNQRLSVLAALSLVDEDLPSLLDHIVEVTTELLPASGGSSVTLWNAESQAFQLTATTVPGQTPALAQSRIRTKGGATRWIMDNKRACIVPDVSKDVFGDAPMLAEFNLKAFVGVPLLVANEVLGVLYAFDKQVRNHSQEDVHFMTILAGRVAQAIYLTRLLEKTQSALSSTRALQRVSSSLISPADGLTALHSVVENIAEILPASRVLLLTLDVPNLQVTRFVTAGQAKAGLEPDSFEQYWQGLTGWVMREKSSTLSLKGNPDPRESPLAQEKRKERNVGSILIAPLRFEEEVYGTLTAVRELAEDDFGASDLGLMEELASQAAITIRNSELYEETKYLATIDDLTGCLNRRHLFELGERELKRHHRLKHPLAALMFDIDRFKDVNDRHGHAVGDEVLRVLCERASLYTREIDLLGRYGGEEFALLLPETDLTEALEIAERLRLATSEIMTIGALSLRISISIGVTDADGDVSLSHLLQRADTALYQAKNKGRNCVVALPSTPAVS
jgi:diguanylate cyclase (GGDEF)-like protein